MEEMNIEKIKELSDNMERLFNSQVESMRLRLTMLGMKILVSDKKVCLVRENNAITGFVNQMGIHSAPEEISYSIELSEEESKSRAAFVLKSQRKLMVISLISRVTQYYGEIIREKNGMPEMKSIEDAIETVKEGIDQAKSIRREEPVEMMEQLQDVINKLAQ